MPVVDQAADEVIPILEMPVKAALRDANLLDEVIYAQFSAARSGYDVKCFIEPLLTAERTSSVFVRHMQTILKGMCKQPYQIVWISQNMEKNREVH